MDERGVESNFHLTKNPKEESAVSCIAPEVMTPNMAAYLMYVSPDLAIRSVSSNFE
jgi:hypothetical protein